MSRYKNSALKRCNATYSYYGLAFLLLLILTWQFANITKLTLLKYLMMLSMVPAIVWITCGKRVVYVLRFQLCTLLLLLPVGQEIFIYLQNMFAGLTVNILSMTKQAVYWDGNNIYLGDKHYVISSFFISLHFLMVYLAIGVSYAFFVAHGLLHRLVVTVNFVLFPFVLLLIAFLTMLMLVNDISTNSVVIISWSLTTLGIASAIYFGWRIGSRQRRYVPANDIDWQNSYSGRKPNLLVPVIVAISFLSTATIVKHLNFEPKYAENNTLHIPANLAAWGKPITFSSNDGQSFLAEYKKNKQNIFLACSDARVPNQLTDVNRSEWQPIKNRRITIELNKKKLQVVETVLRNKGISRIIWSFYNTNGHITADSNKKLILERLYGLGKHGIVSTTTAIATHVDTDLNAGRNTLFEFLQTLQGTETL